MFAEFARYLAPYQNRENVLIFISHRQRRALAVRGVRVRGSFSAFMRAIGENLSTKFQLEFRIATELDAETLVVLVNSVYRGDTGRKGWTTESDLLDGSRTDFPAMREMIAAKDSYVILAIQNRNVVGCVHIKKVSPELAYLGMLSVDAALQTAGFGKSLVTEAERFAREELGCSEMEMTVIALRQELISWYERRGYRMTSEKRPFPTDVRFGIPLVENLEFVVLRKSIE